MKKEKKNDLNKQKKYYLASRIKRLLTISLRLTNSQYYYTP